MPTFNLEIDKINSSLKSQIYEDNDEVSLFNKKILVAKYFNTVLSYSTNDIKLVSKVVFPDVIFDEDTNCFYKILSRHLGKSFLELRKMIVDEMKLNSIVYSKLVESLYAENFDDYLKKIVEPISGNNVFYLTRLVEIKAAASCFNKVIRLFHRTQGYYIKIVTYSKDDDINIDNHIKVVQDNITINILYENSHFTELLSDNFYEIIEEKKKLIEEKNVSERLRIASQSNDVVNDNIRLEDQIIKLEEEINDIEYFERIKVSSIGPNMDNQEFVELTSIYSVLNYPLNFYTWYFFILILGLLIIIVQQANGKD